VATLKEKLNKAVAAGVISLPSFPKVNIPMIDNAWQIVKAAHAGMGVLKKNLHENPRQNTYVKSTAKMESVVQLQTDVLDVITPKIVFAACASR
jgi:hypothetical protein